MSQEEEEATAEVVEAVSEEVAEETKGNEKPVKLPPLKPAARRKLGILAKQVRDHAKKYGLEVFVMHAGTERDSVMITGHYSAHLARNVIAHMANNHPEIFLNKELMAYMALEYPSLFINAVTQIQKVAESNVPAVDGAADVVDPTLEVVAGSDQIDDPSLGQEPEP